jgi:hypothetical protein
MNPDFFVDKWREVDLQLFNQSTNASRIPPDDSLFIHRRRARMTCYPKLLRQLRGARLNARMLIRADFGRSIRKSKVAVRKNESPLAQQTKNSRTVINAQWRRPFGYLCSK